MIRRSTSSLSPVVVAICASCAGGCAGSRTYVLAHPAPTAPARCIRLVEAPPTSPIAEDARREFRDALASSLTTVAMVDRTDAADAELTLRYRIVQYDAGNAAVRIGQGAASLLGSPFAGLGDGSVGVEVLYLAASGEPLGHIVADGPIAGLFGSTSGGLEAAAETIAAYTRDHFTADDRADGTAPLR